jgi:hypothetical protein
MDGIAGPSNIVGLIDAAKSGSPVPNLEIRANWQTRWLDPTTSIYLLVMWSFFLGRPVLIWPWLYWPTLLISILGLVLACLRAVGKFQISAQGIEFRSFYGRRQSFQYSEMIGSFELFEPRFPVGLHVAFRIPDTKAVGGRRVRIPSQYEIIPSLLFELLVACKAQADAG